MIFRLIKIKKIIRLQLEKIKNNIKFASLFIKIWINRKYICIMNLHCISIWCILIVVANNAHWHFTLINVILLLFPLFVRCSYSSLVLFYLTFYSLVRFLLLLLLYFLLLAPFCFVFLYLNLFIYLLNYLPFYPFLF